MEAPEEKKEGEIVVKVQGFRKAVGQCGVCLFKPEQAATFPFPKKGKIDGSHCHAMAWCEINPETLSITHRFESVSAGTYAVAILHDVKKTFQLDRNFMGAPKDGVGASMGAKGRPPKFAQAQFPFEGGVKEILISVTYVPMFSYL